MIDKHELTRLEEAAEWLQTLLVRPGDDAVLESWLDWCAREPGNQQAFDGLLEVWRATGELLPVREAVTQDSAQSPASRRTSRRYLLAAAVAGVALMAGGGAWMTLRDNSPPQRESFVSPIGVNTVGRLPDGSVMELGGRSQATLTYTSKLRQVDVITGEAFFTVQKDQKRPFVVTAGSLQVTAVGTAFNVRRMEDRVVVSVSEGAINVARAGSEHEERERRRTEAHISVLAGQELVYIANTKSISIRSIDPSLVTAWRTGVLKFVEEPMAVVIASINRYSPREIVIRDADVADLRFTGTARIDRIENWLRAVENAFSLTVVDLEDGRVLLAPARAKGGKG